MSRTLLNGRGFNQVCNELRTVMEEVVFNRKAMDIVEATNAELTWHRGKIHNSLKDNEVLMLHG